jgi:AcrR family transcriptional regulator
MTTPSSARPQRRDAVVNRAGILAAATETLGSDPRASLDTIARSAGLSRRALYGHFADRETLVRDVIAAGAQRFNDLAGRADHADPAVALAGLASLLWAEASHVQVIAAIALDDAHVQETADALAPLRRAVHAIVRRGQESGRLRTDVAAPTLARLIEETARTVITRVDASSPDARSLVVRATLSIAGLSWREGVELLAGHPGILEEN